MELLGKGALKWVFQRENLCTHITALKAFHNFLFVAESNQILLFDWQDKKLLEKEIVFQSCSIHGIKIDNNKILIFGAKSIRVYEFNSTKIKRLIEVSKEFYVDDWIHDVHWLTEKGIAQNNFVVISAHNCLTFWESNQRKIKMLQCSENCILYTASIISYDTDAIVIAAGTVFKKILLWSPNFHNEISGRIAPFHSLTGHQGVIFSITYSKYHKLICSTSDDRSVRLWKIQNPLMVIDDTIDFWVKSIIQCIHVLFAHESRVWMSTILNDCILSVGEDSYLCFWSLTGGLLKKKKCHKGGSVWCLETALIPSDSVRTDIEKYIAFTGGSDGGVYMWDVADASAAEQISQISFHSSESSADLDFPRIISLLTNNLMDHMIVTTDKGLLSLYSIKNRSWKNLFCDSSFSSYCIPSVSDGSIYLALGNMYGDMILFNLSEQQFEMDDFKKFKVHDGKICSIHWVNTTTDYLLTCGLKGHMVFWKISCQNQKFDIQSIRKLYLPKCKHQWWSTAALYITNADCIVVGDRGGTISLYSHIHLETDNEMVNPVMTHRYIHGENGVTDIQEHKTLIYSSGRDGKVQLYQVSSDHLNLLHSIKVSHDLEWIGRMLFSDDDLLLLGFHTKDFVVWSTKLESAIMTVECGGGHRSWDFHLSADRKATFAAIKKKDVIFCQEDLQHVLKKSILKTGISGQEFCQATYLYTKSFNSKVSMSIVACGGEDNALRIVGFLDKPDHESQIVPICSLSGHLSSIRSISKVRMTEEKAYLLVSVGGRSQMMIWKLKDGLNIQCEELASYILSDLDKKTRHSKKNTSIQMNPQTRLMDVAVCSSAPNEESSGQYMISTACSDSYFRVYLFDLNLMELFLCYNLHHGENCILKLSEISIKDNFRYVFFATGSTDGYVKVFNVKRCKTAPCISNQNSNLSSETIIPHLQMKLHQSGINALDVKAVTESTWLICSAGDDNALSVALINFITSPVEDLKLEVISKFHVPHAHASQITGIKIFNQKAIITASIDQRINIWSCCSTNNCLSLELESSTMSLIPDIAHLEVWQNETSKIWSVLVCGQGVEIFKLLKSDKKINYNEKRTIL